ncbi:MAG: type IV pilin N-terminal domain-containing protein [Nitrososphaerota archaeon]|nr:type IV pilin N-terminal domain-containing protein [Nitrososphaerota archaeon]
MRLSKRRRRALSEVVGTVLVVSMTIIAAAAVWGYINGEAGVASQAYGQSVGNSVQYLEEKFTVVDVSWPATCPTGTSACATVWIYNTGNIQLSLLQIRFYDSARKIDLFYNYSSSGTNYVDDVITGAGQCALVATSSYANPPLHGTGAFADPMTQTATIELGIPSSAPLGQSCPSYGQTISTTDTYFFTIAGIYGNSYTYSEVG